MPSASYIPAPAAPSTQAIRPRPLRVLVSRTDRLGDMMLTLPLCALLRERLGARVIVLGRRYTRPVLEASPHVDEIVEWDAVEHGSSAARRRLLAGVEADVVLHVFPRPAIARAAAAARIPLRVGTSHRWYHWLTCNALERFSRRRSPLHEAQLNCRLAERLIGEVPPLEELAPLTALVPRVAVPEAVRARLDVSRPLVLLHPLSGGSGAVWPLERWTSLVRSLDPARVQFAVTGTTEEGSRLREWIVSLDGAVVDLTGALSLGDLIALYAGARGMIASGTGPLHVAAGVGTHALGLFPPTPPVHPGRWAPLGPRAEFLVAEESAVGAGVTDVAERRRRYMGAISVEAVRGRVEGWLRG